MATPKKKRRPGAPLREDINTDPRWVNWEFLAAFGVDDTGHTYLDAIKQHCCVKSDEDQWMEDLVRRAHQVHDRAGHSAMGRNAACDFFRKAGMVLLPDFMDDLGVGGTLKPRAAFWWPAALTTVIVHTNWKVSSMPA
ncbi:MAG: hypothetical protein Q8O14_07665 [bacterium]|nr:hypothetical protein [bacterium]